MRGWQVHELGEPRDVLRLADLPQTTPGAGQLRVRVLASAANFPDALICRGLYQVRPDLPFTPGVELCGEVLEIGDGADEFAVGDRVVGGSVMPHGGFAEEAVMEAAASYPAPEGLDDAQAGGFFLGPGGLACTGGPAFSPARPCSSTRQPAVSAVRPSSSARPPAPR